MSKLYHGSCTCGAVKFEANIDFSNTTTGRCNCSLCGKLRFWSIKVKPEEFRYTSPQPESETLTDFILTTDVIHNPFCKKCGVHAFHRGDVPEYGGAYVSVSISCLEDVELEVLEKAKVWYADGKNNNWWSEPKEKKIM